MMSSCTGVQVGGRAAMGDPAREQELLGTALRRVTDMKTCAAWQGCVALYTERMLRASVHSE